MGKSQRNKGKVAEREFLNALSQALQIDYSLARNLQQSDSGGADCIAIPGLAIEIKRHETLQLNRWWKQAIEQSERLNAAPVLAYRQSRKPWSICVYLHWLAPSVYGDADDIVTINIETLAKIIQKKELMA